MFIWNVASVVYVAYKGGKGTLAGTAGVFDVSDIIKYLDHGKSRSISQLIKDKLRDFQKLLRYFNGTTISTSNILLSSRVLQIIFVLYSKDLTVVVLLLFIIYLFASWFTYAESFTSFL